VDRNKPYGLDRRGLGGMNDGSSRQQLNWGLFLSLVGTVVCGRMQGRTNEMNDGMNDGRRQVEGGRGMVCRWILDCDSMKESGGTLAKRRKTETHPTSSLLRCILILFDG
jgi:hypothetical protein